MRSAAAVLALTLLACTSPAAPRVVPSPSPVPTATPRPPRLAYPVDLAPGARHTLVAAGGKVYLLDDAGRVVSARWMPGGGYPALSRGDDGKTYVTVHYDTGEERAYTYAGDRFNRLAFDGGYYPGRFVSRGAVYRQADTSLFRLAPPARWTLPYLDDFAPEAKGFLGGGRDYDPGAPLAVVTLPSGPLVAAASDARCAVTDPARGRQVVIDAPAPYQWEFCADAAVAPDGNIALLARDASASDPARRDRLVLIEVDPISLNVVRRATLMSLRRGMQQAGRLVALPGGLAAYLYDTRDNFVLDLRGPKPVAHRVPDLGYLAAAAGPDAIFVWGDAKTVARVTLPTGRVERTALRLPGYVSGVVRVP